MKKAILMMAVVFLMSVPMVYADNSSLTSDGGIVLTVRSMGAAVNAATVANTEAHVGSVVLRNDASLDGNVNSNVYGSAIIVNSALGVGAFANLGSVNIKNNSSMTGNTTTDVRGFALLNLATGVAARAHMGSVVVK